jgi:hypothetical protein
MQNDTGVDADNECIRLACSNSIHISMTICKASSDATYRRSGAQKQDDGVIERLEPNLEERLGRSGLECVSAKCGFVALGLSGGQTLVKVAAQVPCKT